MLLKAVVLFAVVAAAVASECGTLERIRVKKQWADAYGDGKERAAFGLAVWRALFHLDPTATRFFDRVNGAKPTSPEFMAHAQRVLSGLDMSISLIDDEEAFNAQLAHLKGQHDSRQIPAYYYVSFGKALGEVLKSRLGNCYDADIFRSCYKLIVDGIKA